MAHSLILERHNTTLTSKVPIPDDLLETIGEVDGRIVEGEPNWGGPETGRVKITSAEQWELFLDELVALERIARNTDATDAYYDEIMESLSDR